jgi:hypothetical protein
MPGLVKPGVDKVRCIPACIQTSRAPFDLIVLDSTVRLCRGLQRREVRRPQTDLLAVLGPRPDSLMDQQTSPAGQGQAEDPACRGS